MSEPEPVDRLPRFSRGETIVHRATTLCVAVLVTTGAALYYEPLVLVVGRRPAVELVHIVAGLLLPVPMLVGLAVCAPLRADVTTLGRMAPVDWEWLRRADRRRARLAVGKFNGGQKLAAAVIAGAGLVLLLTGVLLIAPARVDLPVGVRQGATIVHDLFSFGLVVLLAGHVWLAWSHPESRRALRTGAIDRRYAEREYAGWAAEVARRGGGQVVDGGRAAEEQGSADKGRQNKGRPNNGPLGERPTARQGPVR